MNPKRMEMLLAAARTATAPEPSPNFAERVMHSVRREQRSAAGLFDQISSLFPRLALAAVAVLALCVAADFYFTQSEASLATSVQQVTEQWLFARN